MTKLTEYERQNLINQFRLIDALNDSNENENAIKALIGGFEGSYNEEVFKELERTISTQVFVFVKDVLKMHEVGIQSYKNLDDNQKSEDLEHKVMFKGFDANTQYDCYRCVQYILDDLGLYETVKKSTSSYNTHSSSKKIKDYTLQIAKFEECEIERNNFLTKEQLEHIFK
ncbi:YfbU family protein [Staphylococcus equorum]|uniref:YfbU family protein n=1 Tax=Staphylococcus equorum TaxID=246432 RepID=UPI0020CECE2E|nr:YfbU family protein [Staphylococcus equorum]UTT55162.1 YfbU family protein [Staphylococcus equorum]UTT55223.1 YfbU family protein [Staphylococcus equorum]